jgi:hypothetical protein
MNKDELLKKLEAQRKWRAAATAANSAPVKRKRLSVAPYIIVAGIGLLGWLALAVGAGTWHFLPTGELPHSASPAAALVVPTVVVPTVAVVSSPATEEVRENVTMTVCAGGFETAKLHVRFEAGLKSDVRGYLAEGETVLVPLGERGEPITKLVDNTRWVFIQSPITGWVSASHLCK